MVARMIRVYLDTSDYVRLYRDDPSSKHFHIRQSLLNHVDSKRIAVGFSWCILFELLQDYDPAFEEDRLQRAQFVSRLCSGNCLPFIDGVLEGKTFSTEYDWMPQGTFQLFGIGKMVETARDKLKKD
jgi:hypothetical protein